MFLGAAYSLWLCNRILFGNLKLTAVSSFRDLTKEEFLLVLPFAFLTFFFGLFPSFLINILKPSILVLNF
jgi:NADH-quinone oxidoreductase subunit M